MGMAAILFNGPEPFEQIVNVPSTEGPMGNLVKIGKEFSKKMFKDFMIYSPGTNVDNPWKGQNFDPN